jgi:hypothetical protein
MDAPENVFDKLHRLGCDRDRKEVNIRSAEAEIIVLEGQLGKKKQELSDWKIAKSQIEAKITAIIKENK